MREQLEQFDLANQMDKITFVTDRGSNFKKAFHSHSVLYCAAHRLNNILKRCFYHTDKKKKKNNKSPAKAILWSTTVVETEITPTKKKTVTTRTNCASPEVDEEPNSDLEDVSSAESWVVKRRMFWCYWIFQGRRWRRRRQHRLLRVDHRTTAEHSPTDNRYHYEM